MDERKSVFKRGAECGVPMGLYMSTISLMSLFTDKVPLFSLAVIVMLFVGPYIIYRFQRHYFIEENGMTEYAALWMQGILMVVYGALITGAVTYLVLQYIRPSYIYDQAQMAIDTYNAIPSMKAQLGEILDVMQQAIDQNALPTPIELVFQMFWFVTFSGCMLSSITAAFASRRLS